MKLKKQNWGRGTRSLDPGMTVLSCQNVAKGSLALAWPAPQISEH